MTGDLALVLVLLVIAVALFLRGRPPVDMVALLMVALLPFTGVVTVGEAIAGFSDPNIVLIALLFVLGEGLVRTGVVQRIGDWISRQSGGSELRLMVLLMVTVGIVGSVMNSTAIVAIFIPVVLRICQQQEMAPSRLLMPLGFAGLIAGMMTLVATSTNLVVNAELLRQGKTDFGFFTFTPFGIVILVLAILYMSVARRWLPDTPPGMEGAPVRPRFRDWIERYRLADREIRARVKPGSPLAGSRPGTHEWRAAGINLLAIERGAGRLIQPTSTTELLAGDILLLDIAGAGLDVEGIADTYRVDVLPLYAGQRYFSDRAQDLGMVEAIVPAESGMLGRAVLDARTEDRLGLTIIGLRRGGEMVTEGLLEERMRVGDTLLLIGFWDDIQQLQRDGRELVPLHLPVEFDDVLPAHDRAPQAMAILALVVVLLITEPIPNVHAVLIGCLLLGAFKCIDVASAYRSINWKSLVLIVGMLPFSLALKRTGGVDMVADGLLEVLGESSPRAVLATIFVITAGLGIFISKAATAILMAPIAVALADDLQASPLPFAMMVALAASTAFMSPVSSAVTALIVGPGNYRFVDFLRMGVPFAVVVLITSVLLVPLVLPP